MRQFLVVVLLFVVKQCACEFMHGLSFGGWLLTEPSWMYDQFDAPAENDLVRQWRNIGGDDYAIHTFKNHWNGYISKEDLDTIKDFGITHVRLPVGYWIVEAPVYSDGSEISGATMYDYGFNHEGFVTGRINHLETMIRNLKSRGIKVIIDLHAVPGAGSSCQSYSGIQLADINQSFWYGSPPSNISTPISGVCEGAGPYYSSRGNNQTWMQIGESAVYKLANWITQLQSSRTLADTVESFLIVNEPGLAWSCEDRVKAFHSTVVPNVQKIFAVANLNIHINVNFIGANEAGMGTWMAQQETNGVFSSTPQIFIDYHDYYNWDGSLSWSDLNAKICSPTASSKWSQYTSATPSQPVYIGEWSDATNLDNPQFINISDTNVVTHLKQLHANQLSLFYTSENVIGAFY